MFSYIRVLYYTKIGEMVLVSSFFSSGVMASEVEVEGGAWGEAACVGGEEWSKVLDRLDVGGDEEKTGPWMDLAPWGALFARYV